MSNPQVSAWIKRTPNTLTVLRIALSALVFFLLAAARGAAPGLAPGAGASANTPLLIATALLFVFAASTDFFDGWLARRLDAVSAWGAILDPIADKIAIAAAILGLILLEPSTVVAAPGFIILFRELFVSGLREGLAPRGVKLPVTLAAKWKTTAQLSALTLEIVSAAFPGAPPLRLAAHGGLWLAALLTAWTGAEYTRGAAMALRGS